jgi:hypothetical protein
MQINIYGYPYNLYEYYLYNSENIKNIIENNYKNIDNALNYIDGIFAINIIDDNIEYWITDPYGLYPIFINNIENKIVVNFNNSMELIPDKTYSFICHLNKDTSYHSNAISEVMYKSCKGVPRNSPWNNWCVSEPQTIYTIQNNKISQHIYSIENCIDEEDPADIFINTIKKFSNNRKVLIPLSAGYDSRGIYSVLTKVSTDYHRYTYGIEKDFVNSWNSNDNCLPEFDYNYEYQISKNLNRMNGMADMYYKCHNFFIQPYWTNYDIMLTGDGSNEFINRKSDGRKFLYATGIGHHYKTQCDNIIQIAPYCQKRLINISKKRNIARIDLITNIINKTNNDLMKIPFYTGLTLTKDTHSNFKYKFNFNTKETYLNRYIKEFYEN